MKSNVQKSTLLITINSNKTDDSWKAILKQSILKVISNIGLFLVFRGHYTQPKIFNIKTQYTIEKSRKGLIHSHVLINLFFEFFDCYSDFADILSGFGQFFNILWDCLNSSYNFAEF